MGCPILRTSSREDILLRLKTLNLASRILQLIQEETHQLTSQLGKLGDSSSFDECMAQVRAVFDLYQIGHGCLQTLNDDVSTSEALWRVTPDDVTAACSRLVSNKKHPALILGKDRHFPFDLFDYEKHFAGDADVEALYQSFRNNNLIAVYALPIKTRSGVHVFVAARPRETIDLTELLALQSICTNAINKIVQFKARPCETNIQRILNANQKRVLIGLAKGMDNQTMSRSLGLSEDTITILQEQIVDTLGAANARHAIILSLIAGEVSLEECAPN